MKVTADTNVLVRAITRDDPQQATIARAELADADVVALPLTALCELAWVLTRLYDARPPDIAEAIRRLINADNVAVNRGAVDAGLAILDAGGDFADGVIAFDGAWLGADTLISFDTQAVALVKKNGGSARLLT